MSSSYKNQILLPKKFLYIGDRIHYCILQFGYIIDTGKHFRPHSANCYWDLIHRWCGIPAMARECDKGIWHTFPQILNACVIACGAIFRPYFSKLLSPYFPDCCYRDRPTISCEVDGVRDYGDEAVCGELGQKKVRNTFFWGTLATPRNKA